MEAVEATEDRLGDWLSISMGDTQWTGTEMKTSAQTAQQQQCWLPQAATEERERKREKLSLQLDSATRRHTDDDDGGGGNDGAAAAASTTTKITEKKCLAPETAKKQAKL